MKNRTLITGGAGFIGSHLCEKLINDGKLIIEIAWNQSEQVTQLMQQSGWLTNISTNKDSSFKPYGVRDYDQK